MYEKINEDALQKDAIALFFVLLKSQWTFKQDIYYVKNFPIMTKNDLRKTNQIPGLYTSVTSGSTGEQVSVEKYYSDRVWNMALGYRYLFNRKTDVSLDACRIYSKLEEKTYESWGLPREIFQNQGRFHTIGNLSIEKLQFWIEKHDPSYILCTPTVAKELDTSRLSNFKRFSTAGENGASNYSSEELGMIAFECPENSLVYHVNENMIVEAGPFGEAIITSLVNPYIKRYLIGDYIELGECGCGRSLQVISKVIGRKRNMLHIPGGGIMWPNFSSLMMFDNFGIEKFQVIQKEENVLNFYVIGKPWNKKNNKVLENLVFEALGNKFKVVVKNLKHFPLGKFEEFKNEYTEK